MKIAILAHLHYPIAQPYAGGMETHTAILVYELQRQGHDVTLYAAAGSDADLHVVPIIEADADGGTEAQIETAYLTAFRHIDAGSYDYVINNTLNTSPIKYYSGSDVPMLTIFHSPPMERIVGLGDDILGAGNMQYAAVSHITAAQWAAKVKVDVQVVHNGINVDKWLQIYADDKQNYLAWSGRITPEKGTHVAIEAALGLGIPIKLAGTIYDQKYFEDIIRPLLRHPGVEYVGHLNWHELNAHYGHANVTLVTPLWDEPFGLVAVEALASGTPVAAINNGAMPEIINSRVGSLAQYPTAESLAEAISRASGKNPLECSARVRSQFTIKAMVDQYLRLMAAGIVSAAVTKNMVLEDLDDIEDVEGDLAPSRQLV